MNFKRLDLKVSSWSQSVRHYPDKDPTKEISRTEMSLVARSVPESELSSLLDGSSLDDRDVLLNIVPGEFPRDEYQEANFTPNAFGGLWCSAGERGLNGWFYFKLSNYEAVWDQVRTGGYAECRVT